MPRRSGSKPEPGERAHGGGVEVRATLRSVRSHSSEEPAATAVLAAAWTGHDPGSGTKFVGNRLAEGLTARRRRVGHGWIPGEDRIRGAQSGRCPGLPGPGTGPNTWPEAGRDAGPNAGPDAGQG